jgi:hypothetical protein
MPSIIRSSRGYGKNKSSSVTDVYAKNTTLLLKSDQATKSVYSDFSSNPAEIITNGNVTSSNFHPYNEGFYSCQFFGGVSDYLTIPSNINLSGDFTVELWFYDLGVSKTLQQFAYSSSGGFGCGINSFDGNSIRKLDWRDVGSAPVYGATGITPYTWHHAAYVKSGTTFKIFLDGVEDYVNTNYTTTFPSTVTYIGSANNADANYSLLGMISNFRVVSGTALYSNNFTPPTSPLTPIPGTVILACQSNRFLDRSVYNPTVTKSGQVEIRQISPFEKNNVLKYDPLSYAATFSSVAQTTPTNEAYNLGIGDFTIEYWFKYTSSVQYGTTFNLGTYLAGLMIRFDYQAYVIILNSTQLSISGTVPLNTWTHLALVRNNGTIRLYINGVAISSEANVLDVSPNAGLRIGGSAHTPGEYFAGQLSNLRLVKNFAVYTSAFTPPTAPLKAIYGTVFLGYQDATSVDNSPLAATITAANGTLVTSQDSPFYSVSRVKLTGNEGSGWFPTSNAAWLTLPSDSTKFRFNTNVDFTIEAWVNPIYQLGNDYGIIDARASAASNAAWVFGLTTVGGVYKIYFFNAGGNTGSITIPLDAWTHVAVSRVGTNLRLFVNGVLDLTVTGYGGDINPGLASARIGHKDWGSTTYATNGRISNLRVVNGTGIYTNSFVPPTAPLEPVANTVLLLLQSSTPINNNTMVDDSFVTEYIFNSNNVAKNIANPFGHNWSYYFNGTASDYLSVAHSPSLDLSTNSPDFTVECWFNCTTFTTGNQWLFNKDGVAGTSYAQYGISISSTGLLRGLIGTGDGAGGGKNNTFYGSQQIQINRWYHVAMVKTGGVLKFFVDGRLNTSLVPLQTMIDGGRPLLIGWQQSQPANEAFNGYISNLRIVKDVALYQDAFTRPARVLTSSPVPTVYYPESFGTTFNGSSYVSYNRNSYLTTGAHTVEAWIKPTAFPAESTIVSNYRWQIGQNAGWNFRLNSTGQLEIAASIGTYNVQPIIYKSTTSVKINSWSHVAWTRDSANTMRMFINGNYANAEVTYSTSLNLNSDGTVQEATRVGGTLFDGGLGQAFSGTISAIRIVTGGNDSCLYANSFIPQYPLLPVANTVLLISASNTYVNLANTLLVGTTTGSPVIANTRPFLAVANTRPVLLTAVSNKIKDESINRLPVNKFGKVSLNKYSPFDSSIVTPKSYSVALERQNQYINIPNQDWTRFVGEFTMEGWFYWNYPIVAGNVIGVQSSGGLALYYDGTGLMPNLFGSSNLVNTTFKPQVGIWYHIAVTRDGSNRMTMWVNGEDVGNGIVSNTFTRGVYTIGPLASSGNQLRGYVSNFRVVANRALYTKNFKVPEAPLEPVQGTVLLTCQSPTFIDNSTTNSPLQVAGNPNINIVDFNPFGDNYTTKPALYESSVFGGSAYYDGLGDYTIVQDSVSSPNYPLRLGNIFTIQGWFNATSEIAANIAIISKGAVANGWQLMVGRGNVLHFSNATQVLSTSTPIKFNEWNHFAVVRNIGNRTMVFVNGNLESTGTVTNPYIQPNQMYIGGGRVPGANVFTGYISGLRIDRNALYSNNFVPPYEPITSIKDAAYIQDTRVATIDYSMNESMGRAGDVKTIPITPFAPDGTYSVYFDGAGDFFTLTSSPAYSFGTADFTIEMWVNVTSLAATRTFYDTMNSGDGTGTGRFAMQLSTGGTVQIFTGAGSIFTSGGTLLAGSWYHIAYVKNANTGKLYVNGTQVNSTYTDNNNYVVGTNKRPIIGINGFDDSSNPMFGYISNLRVVKGVAVYTGNFTPPSEPLEKRQNARANISALTDSIIPSTANVVLLTARGKGWIDFSDNRSNLIITGGAAIKNFNPFGIVTNNNSTFFDGSGDYLSIRPNSQVFNFGTGDFTFETWMYPMSTSINEYTLLGSEVTNAFSVSRRNAGESFAYRGFANTYTNLVTSANLNSYSNSWIHIAISRANSISRAYINGIKVASNLNLTNYISSNLPTTIGANINGAQAYTGALADLRVTKGIARYTGDLFTPPGTLPYKSTVTAPSLPLQYDVLLVAGGGAGGHAYGGGGGAGGLIATNVNILPGVQYSIIVGGGGGTSTAPSTTGTYNGSNTSAFGLTAVGGGQGGADTGKLPSAGGSGGGAALNAYLVYTPASSTGNAYPGQGFPGGIDIFSDALARSGGGAGGPGGVAPRGAGGVGYKWLDGNYYAGGGGAFGLTGTRILGGKGGGGGGSFPSTSAYAGDINTGGGGGGGAQPGGAFTNGQGGGSGVVIIRYPNKYKLADSIIGSVDVYEDNDYRYYRFTQSANITFDNQYNPNISNLLVSYTLVGSGGGGGFGWGGGGGGGGVVNSNTFILPNVEYTITLGAGGSGAGAYSVHGANGANTIITNPAGFSLISYGGGGGGSWDAASSYPNGDAIFVGYHGGSGGGASSKGATGGNVWLAGQGFPGGRGDSNNSSYDGAGGGGGAAGAGQNGSTAGGRGGYALISTINGVYYGAGGGGGSTGTAGLGGFGGGPGNGGAGGAGVNSANAYSGSGGGGGQPNSAGGGGGSGSVILSHPLSYEAATGTGFTTSFTSSSVLYSFITSGTFTLSGVAATLVSYLAVAGGGGGGSNAGSGAGAGGLLYGSLPIKIGTPYTITVGGGGSAGGAPDTAVGASGGISQIVGLTANIIAIGGGGGGAGGIVGLAGGSGAGSPGPDSGVPAGAAGTPGQGYRGGSGSGTGASRGAGGGGGAGGLGGDAGGTGGAGGAGLTYNITGISIAYAGGGGGGKHGSTGGLATAGGGSGGNSPAGAGSAAVVNTGGGGGGGAGYGGAAAAGGSGVVVLAAPLSMQAASTSGANVTVTTSGGNRIYTFYSSGTITF